jgi:hypothetical protein
MGNRFTHSRGIATKTCDQRFNLCHEGANAAGLFNGALNSGVRISRNFFQNGEGISVDGTVSGVTAEFNQLVNGSSSVAAGAVNVNYSHATHILLRGNMARP